MKNVSSVSKLRVSKRVPNMATFSCRSDSWTDLIEVVYVNGGIAMSRRHSTGVLYEIADPMTVPIGTWVSTIVGVAYLSSNWNQSVIDLAEELVFWTAKQIVRKASRKR